jgi:ubiquinol-cytochrome c reductase iron-sulfur subunit
MDRDPLVSAPGRDARQRDGEDRAVVERRASRRIAIALLLATAAGIGLLVLYALGGQVQLEGALLALVLGGIGVALVLWGKHLFPHEVVTDPRGPVGSEDEEVDAAEEAMEEAGEGTSRRTFLTRLLVAAGGALALALVFPVRSLGPPPGDALFRTSWTRGARLVDELGEPLRVETLPIDGVVTVFPEGHTEEPDSQAILVKVPEDELRLPDGREAWAPQGNVCYSKLCTHAGCPVGLYLAESRQLQCPCHQSAFLVVDGASVVFGPAARPLPQLELYVDGSGFLRAAGDFDQPVGPGFWNRGGEA